MSKSLLYPLVLIFYFMAFKKREPSDHTPNFPHEFYFWGCKGKFWRTFMGQSKSNIGGNVWSNFGGNFRGNFFGKVLDNLGAFWRAIFEAIFAIFCTLFIGILTQPALGSEYLWSYSSIYFHWQNILWQHTYMDVPKMFKMNSWRGIDMFWC